MVDDHQFHGESAVDGGRESIGRAAPLPSEVGSSLSMTHFSSSHSLAQFCRRQRESFRPVPAPSIPQDGRETRVEGLVLVGGRPRESFSDLLLCFCLVTQFLRP